MQYLEFRIKNFRAIESELVLDLRKSPILPLVGMNECGKTTILQAIYCFDPINDKENAGKHLQDTLNLYRTSEDPATITAKIELNKSTVKSVVEKYNKDIESGTLTGESHKTLVLDQLNKAFSSTLTIVRNLSTKMFFVMEFSEIISKEASNRIGAGIVRHAPYILYNDDFNDRPVSVVDLPTTEATLSGWQAIYNRLFEIADEKLSLLSLGSVEDPRRRNTILSDVQEHLNETLLKAWKTFSLDKGGGIGIKLEVVDEVPKKLRVLVVEKIGNKDRFFEVNDRSKGFIWFYNFIMKTQYNPKASGVKGTTIFLLDEPGSYLHSTAQERLCEKLREISEKNGKVVYCTHSHHLLNPKYIAPKDILIVSKNSSKRITVTPLPLVKTKGDTRNALQPVYEALNLPDFEFFSDDRRVVIVEGIYDKYALELFCPLLSDTVVFPSTNADAIVKNIQQFIAYDKDFICIWDNDDEGREKRQKALKTFGSVFEPKLLVLPKGDRKKTRMEEMFEDTDLSTLASELKLDPTANYETVIATLFYMQKTKRQKHIDTLSGSSRSRFEILSKMIEKAFLADIVSQ